MLIAKIHEDMYEKGAGSLFVDDGVRVSHRFYVYLATLILIYCISLYHATITLLIVLKHVNVFGMGLN